MTRKLFLAKKNAGKKVKQSLIASAPTSAHHLTLPPSPKCCLRMKYHRVMKVEYNSLPKIRQGSVKKKNCS